MSNYSYRQKAPAPVLAGSMDHEYDYGPSSPLQDYHVSPSVAAAAAAGYNISSPREPEGGNTVDGDEALLDLAQLEELHKEAEKMKALGNKHMATQEYTRAYNAYSAALQLSPVGPSSHVFLSNRAAALLSLKRYNAAATDARRAIALAPTFGKAHARLGQALYFLKDYEGAVAAYQDAIEYEPDNPVTISYLEKAKAKLEKQRRKLLGEEVSVATSMADSHIHYVPSVATADPMAQDNIMASGGYRGRSNQALIAAATRKQVSPTIAAVASTSPRSISYKRPTSAGSVASTINGAGDVSLLGSQYRAKYNDPNADPDFEEALRIQQQANRYLASKQYKAAAEEYTAALFLVPDDMNLSPELHLGRAHALNGSRRHERAKNDCLLAIKMKPSPAAYSTLAKSYFYMEDYKASLKAFQDCIDLLPPGESLGMFDRAYYEKAEAALEEEEASLSNTSPLRAGFAGGGSVYSNKTVPKLPPPRFVPRDEAIHATPNLPSMPKQWPQQSPRSPTTLRCGPERQVLFLSEALGIKLNRGSDGIVRVLSVTPSNLGSPVVRRGELAPGDVVRECAGVDLRRPITNIMWGDTVALIKMAPRPITFLVAQELSEVPPVVQEEMRRATATNTSPSNMLSHRPSNANGDEPVRKHDDVLPEVNFLTVTEQSEELDSVDDEIQDMTEKTQAFIIPETCEQQAKSIHVGDTLEATDLAIETNIETPNPGELMASDSLQESDLDGRTIRGDLGDTANAGSSMTPPSSRALTASDSLQLRGLEDEMICGEIVFERTSRPEYNGWDNLRWLTFSGIRKVAFSRLGYRYFEREKKQLLWSTDISFYEERLLAVYDVPSLILILRQPTSDRELETALGLVDASEHQVCTGKRFWIVESVVEPASCILKLSPLTSIFSSPSKDSDERRLSCFELRNPIESIYFSPVHIRDGARCSERSFSDSGAFLEASTTEMAVRKKLCAAHQQVIGVGGQGADALWEHQIIHGTLHSVVVSGHIQQLEGALQQAMMQAQEEIDGFANLNKLAPAIIDERDGSGYTPLYYAVARKMSKAVALLVKAGASTDFRASDTGMTLLHISARLLDDLSLSLLLATESPRPNPNTLDAFGRTPMYVAIAESEDEPRSLERCLKVLDAWGGQILIRDSLVPLRSPVYALSSMWRAEALIVLLRYFPNRFSGHHEERLRSDRWAWSLNRLHEFPLHAAILALDINMMTSKFADSQDCGKQLISTLRVLLNHGFEVNERMPQLPSADGGLFGLSPLQSLAVLSVRIRNSTVAHDSSYRSTVSKIIRETALFLSMNGARVLIGAAQSNLNTGLSNSPTCQDKSTQVSDGSNLVDWTAKNELFDLLGVDEAAVKHAWTSWCSMNPVDIGPSVDLVENGNAPVDGDNFHACTICWKTFGSLFNRRHRCRVTGLPVCDECSSKRVLKDNKPYRVSDGQYLRARAEATRTVDARLKQKGALDDKSKKSNASEELNRSTLLGNVMDQASGLIFGTGEHEQSSSLSGLTSSMNETRDALNQRGERLSQLGDKSADLVDASANFAKMAKELARESERGFFW